MKFGKAIVSIVLGGFISCHAPVLLTGLSPDSKPIEKFKYYQSDFILPKNSLLRTNGFYYNTNEPRQVPINYKAYLEAKEHGIAPVGFSLNELDIHSDTIVTVVDTKIMVFYPDGTFVLSIYHNKSVEEIQTDTTKKFKDLQKGWYAYKLENNKLKYEIYSKMSGFNYYEGTVGDNIITVGESNPYQFIPFQ
ncbi:MAG: hypothetical protein ACK5IC_07225 [Moheibacter sp.]